ncbi:MAG TPA: hypothetical protein PLZ64_03910 [Chitinophagales bacterium]|nr:hypothetical protein [Chitinophagales bacterium]
MQLNLSFQKSLIANSVTKVKTEQWDKAMQLYESGAFADAVRACINYIDPAIETKYANADKTEYYIPHGSILVALKISETDVQISAPFLNIEQAKRVPILRQVAQLNFSPLTITEIVLDGDKLFFTFQCALAIAEPYKIYEVLREICINADNYDDEFISKFDAKHLNEPKITPYTAAQNEQAWNTVQQYIKEAFTVYEQLENKRLTSYLWDVLVITILKIDYFCAPQGLLRSEIEKTLIFLNSKEDYYQRLSTGKEFLRKLQNTSPAELERSLYNIEIFIPYKFRTDLESVRNTLKYAFETAEKEIRAMDFIGATLTLEYGILNLLYNNTVENAIAERITQAMESASEKPIQEAANLLFEAVKVIMTVDVLSAAVSTQKSIKVEKEKQSIFKKLFG